MPSLAGRGTFRRSVISGASTLAIAVGMLGALGSAVPATATQAVAKQAVAVRPAALSSSLSCVYIVVAEWPGGFEVEITLTNTGTSPVSGWSLSWIWPGGQQLTGGWNASFSQSGATVTVRPVSSDWTIAPGSSVTFGFTASGTPPPVLPIPCKQIG